MPTPDIKDIMASVLKTPVATTVTHGNNEKVESNQSSNDATASSEAIPLLDPINQFNKELFLNKVKDILKHKVSDSNDLKNAMNEISSLLYDN